MHHQFWHDRWSRNEIGFHEREINPSLIRHWPALSPAGGGEAAPVFVPLCGKSLDMGWLAGRGHKVIGVELSPVAIADFFAAEGLSPEVTSRDGFEVSSAKGIELWCGDFFRLEPHHLAGIGAVYDRAALIALPPAMQPDYADAMARLLPAGVPTLMITIAYDQAEMTGPPFAVPPERVAELYERNFTISELGRREALASNTNLQKRGLTALIETTWRLDRR